MSDKILKLEQAQTLYQDLRTRVDAIPPIDNSLSDSSTNSLQNKVISEELKKKVDLISNTVTGNPCTFNSTIGDIPLKSIKINWTPVQAGTGDPSPSNVRPISGVSGLTVTRCGVNLLNLDRQSGTPVPSSGSNTTNPRKLEFDKYYVGLRRDNYYYPDFVGNHSISNGTIKVKTNASNEYGLTFPIRVTPNRKYTISAVSENALFGIGYYDENWNYISSNAYTNSPIFPITFTAPANAYCATLVFRGGSISTFSTYSNIQVEVGETASEYTPYVGTAIPVTFPALGNNLFNKNGMTRVDGKTYGYQGQEETSTASGYFAEYIPVLPNKTYTISGLARNAIYFYDANKGWLGRTEVADNTRQFTTWDRCYFIRIQYRISDLNVDSVMMNEGSSALPYEPYTNTVYGGSLDLVTRELTVNFGIASFEWSTFGNKAVLGSYERRSCVISEKPVNSNKNKCNVAPYMSDFSSDSLHFYCNEPQSKIFAFLPVGTDEETEVVVAYELAEPFEIQLTPQQITALVGDNVIWSDTNGSIEVENYIDLQSLKDYIDEQSVHDVQINGTSVVVKGTANVPMADSTTPGVAKVSSTRGVSLSSGTLTITPATKAMIKAGTDWYKPLGVRDLKVSIFYGLAKLAGADMASLSGEIVGVYPEAQKAAIQNMLGITDLISTEETSTATAAHAINSTFMMGGKLHHATAAIAIGDAVEVGTNCEVVKADEVFVKKTDYASTNTPGIIYTESGAGLAINNSGKIFVVEATESQIKAGTNQMNPVAPAPVEPEPEEPTEPEEPEET